MFLRGRAWVFGHNVDTDQITPGRFLFSPPEEAAPHTLGALNPAFAHQVRPGDMVVAGENFGCGSSREVATQVFKHLQVGCILAEGFSRIFFRNAVAMGLPVLAVKGVSGLVQDGDELEVSLELGQVRDLNNRQSLQAAPLPPAMRSIIQRGGIDRVLQEMAMNTDV